MSLREEAYKVVRLRAMRFRPTTRRRVGPRTASPPAPAGMTSPTTGAARTAARPSRTSRWSRSRAGDRGERSDGGMTGATLAHVSTPSDRRTAPRVPYAEASRVLLRGSILDGMRDMLLSRDWSVDHTVRRRQGRRDQPPDHLQRVRLTPGPGPGVCPAPGRPPGGRGRRRDRRQRRRDLRRVPRGLPGLLRRVGVRPAGHLVAHRRGQARPAADHHHRQRADHHVGVRSGSRRPSCTAGCAPAKRTPECWPGPSSGWR